MDWAFAVENFLVLDGMVDCIRGTEEDTEKNAKAKAKIILTIDTSIYIHIKQAVTAKEMWDKLKTLYDDSGFTQKISLLLKLISTRLEDDDSMSSYVNRMVETAQRLRRIGFKIDDEWVGSLLLAGLPEKYAPMIMAIEHSGINIETDKIKIKLLDMEGDVSKTGSAFTSRTFNKNKKYHNLPAGGSTSSSSRSKVKCSKCKQFGLFKNKCPELQTKKTKNDNAFSAVFISGQFNKNEWYIDSGASFHMTANKDWLSDITNKKDLNEIIVANKNKMSVDCIGSINIITQVKNSYLNINKKFYVCQNLLQI